MNYIELVLGIGISAYILLLFILGIINIFDLFPFNKIHQI